MTKAPTIKLNDNTIRLQLQALLSEIRTDGIETPLLDFFHFLQFVVPRESVFTKLYVEVGLVEYSHRTGEGSVSDEREIQEMEYIRAPSLRVIVWVGRRVSASIRLLACGNRALCSYFAAFHVTSVTWNAFRRRSLRAWTYSDVARYERGRIRTTRATSADAYNLLQRRAATLLADVTR